MGYKAYLISNITSDLDIFKCRENKVYADNAAVAYGVYKAIGGKKVVPLPLFTDNIINIVYKCATILYKTKKQSLNKIAIKLQDEFEKKTIIVMEDTEENKSIILGINNKEYLVNSNDISTLVSEITILILENSETYLDTKSIESLIYKYFYEIRRA